MTPSSMTRLWEIWLVSCNGWREPARNTPRALGVRRHCLLLLMTFLTWRLNAAYWKDVK